MTKVSAARLAAYTCVNRCRLEEGYAKDVMGPIAKDAKLSSQDRGLALRLSLGTMATSGYLLQVLGEVADKNTYITHDIQSCFMVSIYELLYMATPVEVVVSQGVELVGEVSSKAKPMANAILRRVAKDILPGFKLSRERIESGEASFKDYQKVSGLPGWLLKKIKKSQPDTWKQIAVAQESVAPIYVGYSSSHLSQNQVEDVMEKGGLAPKKTSLHGCYEIGHTQKLESCPILGTADIVVSDMAAQAICILASMKHDGSLLEIGQGRASKTLLMGAYSAYRGAKVTTVAIDSIAYKVDVAKRRLSMQMPDKCNSLVFDATRLADKNLPSALAGRFDRVFCDMPCTGTGTLRRHPEICWSLSADALNKDDATSLVNLQANILSASAARVADGGLLIYSTCSLLREENSLQIESFLGSEAGREFELVDIASLAQQEDIDGKSYEFICSHLTQEGYFQTTPCQGGCDGHFCAVMRKIK